MPVSPKTPALRRVALDARMIRHSGIGTALRGLLRAWSIAPPPFELTLMGNFDALESSVPGELDARRIPFDAPIYGPGALMARAPVVGADVFLTMHYSTVLRPWSIPQVSYVHDLIHITHPTRRGTALYMKTSLALLRRRARFILTGSRHTKVQLQTLHGFPAHRVLTIPWGPGLIGAEPRDPGIAALEGNPFLLASGLYKPHKNWDFLLERLARLWANGGLALPLAATGLGETGRAALLTRAERLGIAERLVILPHLDDGQMTALYARATALLFPSLIEGFGFPIVEAMASGTPVVAADLPPMNEVGGKALVRFDPDVPETFDRAVLSLTNDEAIRTACIERGKTQAALYDWGRTARTLEDVLQRAINPRQDS